jgi:DNA repair protein RAD57
LWVWSDNSPFIDSGSGKTQFLLNLLLAAQLPQPQGIGRKAIYISTEAPLSTPRLSQLLETHPYLSTLPADTKPSLANVLSITAIDLETQDHILNYQVPVAISRYNVGLVVIDSIAANVRAEHTSNSMLGLSTRSGELAKLGQLLRNLAANHDIAVVVANQVSDRFDSFDGHQGRPYRPGQGQNLTTAVRDRDRDSGGGRSPLPKTRVEADTLPSSSPAPSPPFAEDESFDGAYIIGHPVRNETLSLAHQERFFTGWGDTFTTGQAESQKTPALGFVWSTQIACRIALKKDDEVAVPMPDVSRTGVPASTPSSQAPPKTTTGSETQTPISKGQAETDIGASSTNEAESHRSIKGEKHPPPPPPLLFQPADHVTKRRMKLVFAPWTSGMVVSTDHSPSASTSDEIEFEIWKGGIRSIQRQIDL